MFQRIQVGFHRSIVNAQELVGGGHHVDTVGLALRTFLVHELVDRLIHWSALDVYKRQGLYYPGGNCVNVAVNCKRDGFEEAAYMGVFGDDDKAEYLKWALDQEGIS